MASPCPSYAGYRFPADIIHRAVWMYLRFTLSYRDVEELLAERGIQASYETVRRWVLKFGPVFARNLRRLRPRACDTWHLDEIYGPLPPCKPDRVDGRAVCTNLSGLCCEALCASGHHG